VAELTPREEPVRGQFSKPFVWRPHRTTAGPAGSRIFTRAWTGFPTEPSSRSGGNLGLEIADWGGVVFEPLVTSPAGRQGTTVWSIFPADTTYFRSRHIALMINYRVEDLDAVLAALRAEGCQVDDRVESSEFGRFGWVMDIGGNRLELWEPPRTQV
jgi:hypothetical protein